MAAKKKRLSIADRVDYSRFQSKSHPALDPDTDVLPDSAYCAKPVTAEDREKGDAYLRFRLLMSLLTEKEKSKILKLSEKTQQRVRTLPRKDFRRIIKLPRNRMLKEILAVAKKSLTAVPH